MSPSRHRWSSNPDWPHVRNSVEAAIRSYMDHGNKVKGAPDDEDLINVLSAALIDLAECVGITTHVYG